MKRYFVHIVASQSRVIHTGVTSNLARRIIEHRAKAVPGFTAKYDVSRLVYVEEAPDPWPAIRREKGIKGWRREKKIRLIEALNPEWTGLADSWRLFRDSSLRSE